MKHLNSLIAVALLGVGICGCSTGRDNVLFATKSSLAVDIDTEPPTFDVGFARKEGTLAPVYENGGVLPQMASFHNDVGWFKTGVGQSFATGNAAVLLAKHFSSTANPSYLDQTISEAAITNASLATVPTGKRKRYFFGTDSSFGVKIHFSPETGYMPTSMSVGYKRKELAYVPIVTVTNAAGQKTDGLASLLGSAGLATSTTGAASTSLVYNQFFATGLAADYLASQFVIRRTIGFRIINDQEVKAAVTSQDLRKLGKAEIADASRLIDNSTADQLENDAQLAVASGAFTADDLKQFHTLNEADKRSMLKASFGGESEKERAQRKKFIELLTISRM